MSSIKWIIELLDEEYQKKRRSKNVLSSKRIPVDKSIKFCEDCSSCWEEVWWDGHKKILYYRNFPSIGKAVEKCGCLNDV